MMKDKAKSGILRLIPGSGASRASSTTTMMDDQPAEASPELANLLRVLDSRFTRNRLIASLIPINKDLSVKARFVIACEEYKSLKDKAERRQKARKIVATFVQIGSLYQMEGIPSS